MVVVGTDRGDHSVIVLVIRTVMLAEMVMMVMYLLFPPFLPVLT